MFQSPMRIPKAVKILLKIGVALLLVSIGLLITAGAISRDSNAVPDEDDGERTPQVAVVHG